MHGLGRGQSSALSKEGHSGKETLVTLKSEELLAVLEPFSTVGKDAEVFFIVRVLIIVFNALIGQEDSFPSVFLFFRLLHHLGL